MLEFIRLIKDMNEKIKESHLSAYAAQSAYFIILSAVPFVMFLLTILNFINFDADGLIVSIVGAAPSETSDILLNILEGINVNSSGAILSFSIIALLWSAGKGVMAITKGLNSVYGIPETRHYVILRLVSTFYTLMFAVIIIFTLAFLVFGNKIYLWICTVLPFLDNVAAFIISARTILSLLILTIFFVFLYKFLPNRKCTLKRQLPGAIFTASGWMISSYIFSIYVDYSPGLSYMYGSLTGLIILMLWLYFCMNLLFLGAEINYLLYPGEKNDSGLKY